jgi:tetratricopeptide (TPR) repeat protein
MYLRTPKRYTRGQRRSPVSLRWLWLWILTPIVVYFGIQIYQNRDIIAPPIQEAISNVVDSAQDSLSTVNAPTPLPTQDPTERLNRADDNWTNGRIEAAISDYQSILASTPNEVQPFYRVTLGLLMEGKLDDALEMAERTVTADPFSADAWSIRAMALDWNGRYGEAIASALRALELNPDSARAMAYLAEAYLDSGNDERARETVERAIEIDPNSYEAYRIRALIYQTVDFDNDAARADFQQAYDLAPNLPQQAIDLSKVLITVIPDQPDYETPIGILRDVIELNPQNSIALYWLGFYYYSGQGDPQQALDYLSRCTQSNPESIECQGLLGRVQMALNDNASAIEALQRAINLDTPNPRHYLWMGRAHIAMGDCTTAIPFLQKAYEMGTETDEEAATAAADNLAECQAPIPGLIVTEEATPEVEDGS